MRRLQISFVGIAVLVAGWCQPAVAEIIDFTNIEIVDAATPFNASFLAGNIETNFDTWVASPDPANPDTSGFSYASASLRADTFVDFQFNRPYQFTNITFIDRLHSGAGANAPGGTLDYVLEADFIFSQNASFGDADDVTVHAGPYTTPNPSTHPDDFIHEVAIPLHTALFIRYDVVANNGANPGAHTFLFEGQLPGTIQGDFDESGVVDVADFQILADNLFRHLDGITGHENGDFNFNGLIDLDDFDEFKDAFPGVFAAAMGVPEPTSAGLAFVSLTGMFHLMRRRRRRC